MVDANNHKNKNVEQKNKNSWCNLQLFHKNWHKEGARKFKKNHDHNNT